LGFVKPIDGYNHLYVSFVRNYVLILVSLLHWFIYVVDGVSFVYMHAVVVDWARLCFLIIMLACVYVCSFSDFVYIVLFLLLCVFGVIVTHRLPMRTL